MGCFMGNIGYGTPNYGGAPQKKQPGKIHPLDWSASPLGRRQALCSDGNPEVRKSAASLLAEGEAGQGTTQVSVQVSPTMSTLD